MHSREQSKDLVERTKCIFGTLKEEFNQLKLDL